MSVWKFRGPGSIHLVPSSSHKLDTASNVTTPCRVHNLESLLRQSSFQRAKIVLPTQCNIDYPKSIQIGDFEWRELTHQKFIFVFFHRNCHQHWNFVTFQFHAAQSFRLDTRKRDQELFVTEVESFFCLFYLVLFKTNKKTNLENSYRIEPHPQTKPRVVCCLLKHKPRGQFFYFTWAECHERQSL